MDALLWDEDIGNREIVAASPAHAGGVPRVGGLDLRRGKHTPQVDGIPVRPDPRLVPFVQMAPDVYPARDEDVAALRPTAGQPVAAGNGHGTSLRRPRASHDCL